jgi:hypothetical protein
MNPKLNLLLTAAGAGIALLGQGSLISAAIAGPTFSASSNQNYGASAQFNLQQAQSFEAIGNYSGTVSPFAVTASPAAVDNTPVAGDLNAGTSTLTAAFDRNGFLNTANTTSLAVQAGVISLGGNSPTAGVTTGPVNATTGAPATTGIIKAGLSLGIVLNQNSTTGVPTISITGAGSNSGIVGASISSQAIGASEAVGNFSDNLTVINSLTAF